MSRLSNALGNKLVLQPWLLVLAVAALYGGFLWNPIVFDDVNFFNDADIIHHYSESLFSLELRWLPYASLGWTSRLLGMELIWFRLGNLLLHAGVAISLFFLIWRLLKEVHLPERQSAVLSIEWLAFAPALIFALHPAAVYGAGYLIERSVVMATLFTLLMLLAFIEGMTRERKRWFFLSAFFYFCAVFSKEHSVMAPGMALATAILLRPVSRKQVQQLALVFALYFAIAILVILLAKGFLGSVYEPLAIERLEGYKIDVKDAYALSVITQATLYFKYLLLWIVPNVDWMSVDMRESFAPSLYSWSYWAGMGGFLLWGGVSIWLLFRRGRAGLIGWALLFPWMFFLAELSTVRIQEPFVLYRSYLWMPGFLMLLVLPLSALKNRKLLAVMPTVALVLFGLSLERLTTFSHPILLWNDAVRLLDGRDDLIGADRLYQNRGVAFLRAEKYDEALQDFDRAIRIRPDFAVFYANRALAYLGKKQYELALRDFNKSTVLDRMFGKAYFGRAQTYEALQDEQAALSDYRVSCLLVRRGCEKARLEELKK